MGYVYIEIYFKELAHMMLSSSKSTGQTSRLEIQVRDGVAVWSLKSAVLEMQGFYVAFLKPASFSVNTFLLLSPPTLWKVIYSKVY